MFCCCAALCYVALCCYLPCVVALRYVALRCVVLSWAVLCCVALWPCTKVTLFSESAMKQLEELTKGTPEFAEAYFRTYKVASTRVRKRALYLRKILHPILHEDSPERTEFMKRLAWLRVVDEVTRPTQHNTTQQT